MNEIEHHQKLQFSFRQALALPVNFDCRSAASGTMAQWDSVAHLQLVVAIEDEFGIHLNSGDVVDLQSYTAAVAILRKHGIWGNV
jgi:hypothetical protein